MFISAPKKLGRFHRVDFTGYSSNQFSGYRLNGRFLWHWQSIQSVKHGRRNELKFHPGQTHKCTQGSLLYLVVQSMMQVILLSPVLYRRRRRLRRRGWRRCRTTHCTCPFLLMIKVESSQNEEFPQPIVLHSGRDSLGQFHRQRMWPMQMRRAPFSGLLEYLFNGFKEQKTPP